MKMACKGGNITTTENDTRHTLAVQSPSGDTSAKESPSTSGAYGARSDRTSKNDSSSILNGVWMQKDSARIESVFFKDTDALKLGNNMFLNNHKSLSLPGQIFASEGDTVQLKIGFKQPPDMQIEPVKERLKITKTLLRRIWHPTYFMPNPGPDNMQLGQLCKASYEAEVFTCEGKTTTGGFSDELYFSWPLTSNQQDKNGECQARPGNDCQQIIDPNLRASGNANTGRCGEHIDQSRRGPLDVLSRHRYDGEAFSKQHENYFTGIVNTLEQTSNQNDFKVHIVGVDEGPPELGGCKIDVQPGPVGKPTEVEICLDNDPNHSPDFVVPVSHIFKCKPSKFEAPVHVKLISYLVPKPGKQLRVKIMSKTGGADWKQILEVTLRHGNEIEYDVSHFCWHVAVVSEEDEKDGEYHLFNDVWMHIPTGMMLSLFWKDWFSLTKGSKKLEVDHKRIISLPGEVIASVGDTVAADIECIDHPGMKITSVDGSDGRIEIGSAMRKKNFFAMLFRPDPHLESLDATNRFEVIYRANVISGEGQRTDGGFSVPLHVTPSLLRSIRYNAVPAEQERNDDQPSASCPPDAVKQTVTHVAEASGLKMVGPNKGSSLCRSGCNLILMSSNRSDNRNLPGLTSQIYGRTPYNGRGEFYHCGRHSSPEMIQERLSNMPACDEGITTIIVAYSSATLPLSLALKENNLRRFLQNKNLAGKDLTRKMQQLRRNLAVFMVQPWVDISHDLAKIAVKIELSEDESDGKLQTVTLKNGKRANDITFQRKNGDFSALQDFINSKEVMTFIRMTLQRLGEPEYCYQHFMEEWEARAAF